MKTNTKPRKTAAPTWARGSTIPARRIPTGYKPRRQLMRELKDCGRGSPERAFARNAERLAQ